MIKCESKNVTKKNNLIAYQKHEVFWRAVAISIISFFLISVFFEFTMKTDDYDMSNVLYGGNNGEYSAYTLYGNVLFYGVLKVLLSIFPTIPWYTVSQYGLIIASLTVINYILLKEKPCWKNLYVLVTLFLMYEFIVRLTFTKTGGILMASGLFVLMYAIEKDKKIVWYLLGIINTIIGMMIRAGSEKFFGMVAVAYFSAFVIMLKNRDITKGRKIHNTIKYIVIAVFLMIVCIFLNNYNRYMFNNNILWEDYNSKNYARAEVTDYNLAPYREYESQYKELNISDNDYNMWFVQGNRSDENRLNSEFYDKIAKIKKSESRTFIQIVIEAYKNLGSYIFKNIDSYLGIIVIIGYIYFNNKENKKNKKNMYPIIVLGMGFVCYLFLNFGGRLQHHVDAVLFYSLVVLLLYYLPLKKNGSDKKNNYKLILSISGISIIFLNYFYSEISASSYYGNTTFAAIENSQKEDYNQNYEGLKRLSDDKRHFYIVEPLESNSSYICFEPTEVIPKKFYSNIYRTNLNHIDVFEDCLQEYNIKNVYSEITNSDKIYYVSAGTDEKFVQTTKQYIKENYCDDVEMKLVKKSNHLELYRFYNKELNIPQENILWNQEQVRKEINLYKTEQGIVLSGSIYEEGTDYFSQNLYMNIKDKNNGNIIFIPMYQGDDNVLGELSYTYFKEEYIGDIKNVEISIILQNENGLYGEVVWN